MPRPAQFPHARLHVVTGKGGTGKTTVAAALATALAGAGRHVLLVEVEQRQAFATLLTDGTDAAGSPQGFERETLLHDTVAGGSLTALSIDPRAAMQDYLERHYRLGLAGRLVDRSGAVDFAASIAPGLRDVLLTGKVYEAVGRRDRRTGRAYDAVVMDAPPTGRVGQFLLASSEVSGLARVGPVHEQSRAMSELFRSSATVVHLVTLPEEMPVSETLEAADELAGRGLHLGAVVANQVREPVLRLSDLRDATAGRLDEGSVADELRRAGVAAPARTARALTAQAVEQAARIDLQRRELARLRTSGLTQVHLPHLVDGVDPSNLAVLAAALTTSGMT